MRLPPSSVSSFAAVILTRVSPPASSWRRQRSSHRPGRASSGDARIPGRALLPIKRWRRAGIKVDVYDMGWPHRCRGARVDDSSALDNGDAVLIYAYGGKAIRRFRVSGESDRRAAARAPSWASGIRLEVPAARRGGLPRWIGGTTRPTRQSMWKPDFSIPEPPVTRGVDLRHSRLVVL